MQRHLVVLYLLGALAAESESLAAPLTEAHVTKIINEVKVVDPRAGDRTAQLNDRIHDDLALTTGIKSRSELLFQDNTLTRLGPESSFSFQTGTRDMTLQRGTLLLQVPKGLGGATIHTAAVTAAITGTTIMIEHIPQKSLKVLVLEGSLRLSNGRFGDSLLLTPGKMVIMPPNAKRIPDPVTVDLKKIVKTSELVNMASSGKKGHKDKPLPSIALIDQEVDKQQQGKDDHHLIDTNLVIMGKGTNVTLASADVLQSLNQRTDVATAPGGPISVVSATPAPTPVPSPASSPPGPGSTPTPPPPPATDIGPTPTVKVSGDGKKTDERYGDGGHPISQPLVINKPQNFSKNGGTGSIKIEANDSVTVNAMLKVTDATIGAKKGEISINSRKTSGTAIAINSSAQLLALLSAVPSGPHGGPPGGPHDDGGKITFKSSGGDILVDGGTIQADRGTIDIRNNGATGSVTLANAALAANTIKVGALGPNGTLNIGGGTISADTLLRLYAGGSNGTINFTDNVTLSGNSVKNIAGDTVTIFNGKIVTIHGPAPASVFTNHPNYTGFGGNGSTTGTFAGKGATTQPLNAAPGF
jgi:hypothetical protein